MKTKVTAQLISAFVFATRIVQFLFFLNPKFQASSVRIGRKPQRPVFSLSGSNNTYNYSVTFPKEPHKPNTCNLFNRSTKDNVSCNFWQSKAFDNEILLWHIPDLPLNSCSWESGQEAEGMRKLTGSAMLHPQLVKL